MTTRTTKRMTSKYCEMLSLIPHSWGISAIVFFAENIEEIDIDVVVKINIFAQLSGGTVLRKHVVLALTIKRLKRAGVLKSDEIMALEHAMAG